MNGFLVLIALAQWQVIVLDPQGYWPIGFFLREGRWPVVIGEDKLYKYEGTWPWTIKDLPVDEPGVSGNGFAMDGNGNIHVARVKGYFPGDPQDSVLEYVEDGSSWQRFAYPEPDGFTIQEGIPVSITIKGDTSFMFYTTYGSWCSMKMLWRANDSWGLDTVIQPSLAYVFNPDAQVDSSGSLWVFYHQYRSGSHTACCAHQDGGSWIVETVEDVPSTFYFTPGPWLTIRGTAFALYAPTGATKQEPDDTLRFAWRRADGTWHFEKLREFGVRGLGVDAGGLVHGLAAFREDSYAHHVVRDTAKPRWDTLEVVDSVNGIVSLDSFNGLWFGGYMLVDADGFLHATYQGRNGYYLCYATTRPDVRVFESSSEPEPSLVLISAPSGFWITGYSGEARIYDPAGRLVLAREINGKTLINPLKPGVYFVVAGKERARIAVR